MKSRYRRPRNAATINHMRGCPECYLQGALTQACAAVEASPGLREEEGVALVTERPDLRPAESTLKELEFRIDKILKYAEWLGLAVGEGAARGDDRRVMLTAMELEQERRAARELVQVWEFITQRKWPA